MKNWKSEIVCTAFNQGQLPPAQGREVVLVGRSNVGKSTLINALLGKKIAHISSKAGKTRSVNFFRVEPRQDEAFYLVDLPGYGFASRSSDEKRGWWKLINSYFSSQRELVFVIHLVDFRHGFLANDLELTEWMDGMDMPRLVVFTKGDKVTPGRRKSTYNAYVRGGLESILPPPVTMGKNDVEMNRLREMILEILDEDKRLLALSDNA